MPQQMNAAELQDAFSDEAQKDVTRVGLGPSSQPISQIKSKHMPTLNGPSSVPSIYQDDIDENDEPERHTVPGIQAKVVDRIAAELLNPQVLCRGHEETLEKSLYYFADSNDLQRFTSEIAPFFDKRKVDIRPLTQLIRKAVSQKNPKIPIQD